MLGFEDKFLIVSEGEICSSFLQFILFAAGIFNFEENLLNLAGFMLDISRENGYIM